MNIFCKYVYSNKLSIIINNNVKKSFSFVALDSVCKM